MVSFLLVPLAGLDRPSIIKRCSKVFALRNAPTVLTPHFGEFCRFTGVEFDDLQQNPLKYLKSLIETYAQDIKVSLVPCIGLAEKIETGKAHPAEVKDYLKNNFKVKSLFLLN